MFFLDVDGREQTDPFLSLLLERFSTYAEISPSGNGVHILGTCEAEKIPLVYDEKKGRLTLSQEFYQKNPNNHIELYFGDATNRYATFTGNAINGYDLVDGTQAALITLDKDMRKKAKVNYSESRDGDREDFDIVCNLRKQKNGEKFKKLYDEGNWQECGYGSRSEADAGLCSMIAFRTGDNSDAIDRIFRGSALYRAKWDRDDYRSSTIALGIESCHGEFHKSKMEHPYFVKFDEKSGTPYISVPLLAKYVREHMEYILVRDNGK
jgi:primase-polymerase (primpol)-like protein